MEPQWNPSRVKLLSSEYSRQVCLVTDIQLHINRRLGCEDRTDFSAERALRSYTSERQWSKQPGGPDLCRRMNPRCPAPTNSKVLECPAKRTSASCQPCILLPSWKWLVFSDLGSLTTNQSKWTMGHPDCLWPLLITTPYPVADHKEVVVSYDFEGYK
jgi:hypothetical protein